MSLENFINSQFYKRKSTNLTKLGFNFDQPIEQEYKKIQSMLYSEYHILCESMLTMMKKFDIPSSRTMDIIFRLFDVGARSFSQAMVNAVETRRSNPPHNKTFTFTWHKTWFNETVFLRSSYELELAKMLDEFKEFYQTESLRIKYYDSQNKTYRIAVPDFYLPKKHKIIEVKSDYWLDESNMRDKQKAYQDLGYNFCLYLEHKLIENW